VIPVSSHRMTFRQSRASGALFRNRMDSVPDEVEVMAIELKKAPGQEGLMVQAGGTVSKILPLSCPVCQSGLSIVAGLCGNRLVQAILLQSQRIGAELECSACGMRCVLHRQSTLQAGRGVSGLKIPDESGEFDDNHDLLSDLMTS